MSGESFGVVLLPLTLPVAIVGIPAALLLEASRNARLKAEREKIAAQLEAERRRKEAEQHLQIETEKTKVALDRLKKEKERKEEEKMQEQKTRQEEERYWALEREFVKDKILIEKKKVSKDSANKIEKTTEKGVEVLSKLQSIELRIYELDPAISELIKDDLMDIRNSLNEIKKKIGGNYVYFENTLKWLDIRLKEVIKKGEDILKSMENELDVLAKEAIELLTDIEMITSSSFLPDKGKALELKMILKNALFDRNIDKLRIIIKTLTPEVKILYNQYLEREKLNGERRYIIESVQSVLGDMGYTTSRLPDRITENQQAPIFVEHNIPGGGGIRLGFGMDKGLFTEVFHSEDRKINKEEFKKQEKKWCSDMDKFKEKLKEKGIIFDEKWKKDFTDEEIETIIVKSEDIDNIKKEEEFRRRMIQEQRRMQR